MKKKKSAQITNIRQSSWHSELFRSNALWKCHTQQEFQLFALLPNSLQLGYDYTSFRVVVQVCSF